MKVRISELYPSEPSVIKTKVTNIKKAYEKSQTNVEMPEIAIIDGQKLVTNGNNRVYAALQAGLDELEVKDNTPVDNEARVTYLRSCIANAIRCGYQGFANLPVDDSLSDRRERDWC